MKITTVGIDLAKNVFQAHGVDDHAPLDDGPFDVLEVDEVLEDANHRDAGDGPEPVRRRETGRRQHRPLRGPGPWWGGAAHRSASPARRAVEIVRSRAPELAIDGEMQADTAVMASVLQETYPWARLGGPANVLIFPELNSANTAYKLIWRLAGAEAIGPILLGMARPVHVLQRGVEVSDIVNMAAICVVDAQEYAARQG